MVTFYKEYRAGFLDNLRKKGCMEGIRKPGVKLQEDEKLSPSFEDLDKQASIRALTK